MKRIASICLLALTFATPVLAGGQPSVSVVESTVTSGELAHITWSGTFRGDALWARFDCYTPDGDRLWPQWKLLSDPEPDVFETTPDRLPNWDGTTTLKCVVFSQVETDSGFAQGKKVDTLTILPAG